MSEAPSAGATASVRIVQYNLLTPAYSTVEQYPHNAPEDVDNEWRYESICQRLKAELDCDGAPTIFCLQELCQEWCARLVTWFEKHNYHLVYRLYGSAKNNFMGIGIAYPRDSFNLAEVVIERVTDIMEEYICPDPPEGWLEYLYRTLVTGQPAPEDMYERVKSTYNNIIILTLADKASGKEFAVATLHMPCDWRNQDCMTLHALCALRTLNLHIWKNIPLIFAGDFNVKPGSNAYHIMTSPMPAPAEERDGMRIDRAIDCALIDLVDWKPFQSAYQVMTGDEPDFTTRAWSAWNAEGEFKDTLDYIFVRDCTVKSVRPLPADISLLPSKEHNEPSDHLMLTATVEF